MPEISTHPTARALALFGHGKLSEDQAANISAHLEVCSDCRAAVANLPPDSFMGKVKAADPAAASRPPVASPSRLGQTTAGAAPADVPAELANHPKFRIIRELGRGGMGVIYLAEHRAMEKNVALKVISPAVLDNPEALARFRAEVRAAGKLDHQNIARAFDADEAGQLHFLVMEFVEGVSLAQLLEQKGPLPVASACHYARQAALGLQHASEQGMVHRDIKPQNLMLTPKGLVKVLDFGLARLRTERKAGPRLTQLQSFMGTPEYVSPEQAMDAREADIRADIYSLGCTLYCLLAGRPPFVGETAMQVVLAHIEQEAAPLHELRPDVPADLSAVVAKMLAKDPAQRYQRPIEVAQALLPFAKAGAKPVVSNTGTVPPVASSGTGTRIGGDTSRVKGLGAGASKLPAEAVPPAAKKKGSPFDELTISPAAAPVPKKAKKERKEVKPTPAAWWKGVGGRKRWPLIAAAAGALALLLGGIESGSN
jgi:serine/threonine protein kinase